MGLLTQWGTLDLAGSRLSGLRRKFWMGLFKNNIIFFLKKVILISTWIFYHFIKHSSNNIVQIFNSQTCNEQRPALYEQYFSCLLTFKISSNETCVMDIIFNSFIISWGTVDVKIRFYLLQFWKTPFYISRCNWGREQCPLIRKRIESF